MGCDSGSTDFFFFFFLWFWIDCDDASNRSVVALIPKLTQDNQNKTETKNKINGYDLIRVSTRPNDYFFIHQNINYLLKEYNKLLIKDY